MPKKIFLLILLIVLLSQYVDSYFLSDYPHIFEKGNTVLVVGDNVPSSDVSSGSDFIAPSAGLVNYTKCSGIAGCIIEFAKMSTIHARDVSNIHDKDIILVGAGYSAEDTRKMAEELSRHPDTMMGREMAIDDNGIFDVVLGEERYCSKDEDCVLTQKGCCGCNNEVAVNKKYYGLFKGNCEHVACLAVVCVHQFPKVKCINNICEIKNS